LTDKALESIQAHTSKPLEIGAAHLPVVSLIVTNYNYARFLSECIDSCLNQDYQFCEIIVVDDCSTDSSKDVLKSYEERVKVIYHEQNKGQLAAFFTGFKEAKGDFICFIDADDFLDKDAVSAHLYIHLFEKPPVAFSCLRNREVSAASTMLCSINMDFQNNCKDIAHISPRVIHTPSWSWGTTSAMMFRSDVLRLIEPENTEDFRICADYYIAHFANLLGGSMLFDRVKVNYRRHGNNGFSRNFVIGGYKPTGSMKYHGHPSHEILQTTIAGMLINKHEVYEPYFPLEYKYAELIVSVAPAELIKKNFKLDADLEKLINQADPIIAERVKQQIEIRTKAVELFEEESKQDKIESIKNNLMQLYVK
jgi:glycosyltransferase involved in cell wall biosynthesis